MTAPAVPAAEPASAAAGEPAGTAATRQDTVTGQAAAGTQIAATAAAGPSAVVLLGDTAGYKYPAWRAGAASGAAAAISSLPVAAAGGPCAAGGWSLGTVRCLVHSLVE